MTFNEVKYIPVSVSHLAHHIVVCVFVQFHEQVGGAVYVEVGGHDNRLSRLTYLPARQHPRHYMAKLDRCSS